MPLPPSDLANRLLELGLLPKQQLQRAVEEASRTGRRLAPTLVALGYVDEETLAAFTARQYRLPRVDLARMSIEPGVMALFPRQLRYTLRAIPLRRAGPVLVVAMDDPSEATVLEELRAVLKLEPAPVVATVSAIDAALETN